MNGKLIRLFLTDGEPDGVRTMEISNQTIYATSFPRSKVKDFLKREEAMKPGCYILIGSDGSDNNQETIYIGEGSPVSERIKTHVLKKEFWEEAIIFTSKDDYLTKTQIQYLEAKLCKLAKKLNKVDLENKVMPNPVTISEVDRSEMTDFLDSIKLILSSFGYDFFEDVQHARNERIYICQSKGAVAKMIINNDKYIVLDGSTAVIKERASADQAIINRRNKLLEKGVISKYNDKYFVFTQDYAFQSPSTASSVIVGGNSNGRTSWKYQNQTLSDMEAKEIEEFEY